MFYRSLVGLLLATSAVADVVRLAWDASTEDDLVEYRVYYGHAPGNYTAFVSAGLQTTTAVESLLWGQTYFFTVVAVNQAGVMSLPSNEVSYSVPESWPELEPVTQFELFQLRFVP